MLPVVRESDATIPDCVRMMEAVAAPTEPVAGISRLARSASSTADDRFV